MNNKLRLPSSSTEATPANPQDDIFAPIDDIDGWNTDEKCPWCGKQLGELYEYLHRNEEDAEFECPSCERPIKLAVWTQFILTRVKS